MKIKMYTVYYNGEEDMHFLRKKQAIKYVEYLKFYKINEEDEIYYRKEYIYVWCCDTIYGSVSWFNTGNYRYIYNIWFNG